MSSFFLLRYNPLISTSRSVVFVYRVVGRGRTNSECVVLLPCSRGGYSLVKMADAVTPLYRDAQLSSKKDFAYLIFFPTFVCVCVCVCVEGCSAFVFLFYRPSTDGTRLRRHISIAVITNADLC